MIVRIPDKTWTKVVAALARYEAAFESDSYAYGQEEFAAASTVIATALLEAKRNGELMSEREE